MTFRKASLAALLTFSLTACSGLDALLGEALAWLEDARENNTFTAVDADTEELYGKPDDADETFDTLPEAVIDGDAKGVFENSMKTIFFPVDQSDPQAGKLVLGRIEVDDQRLYLEFQPNNAFMAIQPTENEGEFEADIDFSDTGEELIITVNQATRQATVERKDPAGGFAQLVLAAAPSRVVGVDFDQDGKADINLYSDDVKEGGKGQGKPWEDDE